jgi:hypothetical protein
VLVVVLVLENPDRFAIRLTEQISCRTSVSLRSRNPNAPRTSTTTRTRTMPNFGVLLEYLPGTECVQYQGAGEADRDIRGQSNQSDVDDVCLSTNLERKHRL